MHHTRRRNGSKKVPNVKLRPAGPATASASTRSKRDEDQEEFDPTHDGGAREPQPVVDVQAGLLPFRGAVISATGNVDKVDLAFRLEQMGGRMAKHLTDDVRYLVADGPGSAKYDYAVRVALPIMTPSWIIDTHERYKAGEDFTLEDTLPGYQLPCFEDLKLCISGENRLENRMTMARLITEQGAAYLKDLNEAATHLLICGDAETFSDESVFTPKVEWALQVNKARQRDREVRRRRVSQRRDADDVPEPPPDIHIVWVEWFWDCLKFGGRHPESEYDVKQPRPDQKPLPNRAPLSTPSFALATTSTQLSPQIGRPNAPAPRFENMLPPIIDLDLDDDSDAELQPAVLKKATTANAGKDALWQKMVSSRTLDTKGKGKAVAMPTIDLDSASDEDGESQPYLRKVQKARSAPSAAAVTNTNTSTKQQPEPESHVSKPRPFTRIKGLLEADERVSSPVAEIAVPGADTTLGAGHVSPGKPLFGKTFVVFAELHGEHDALMRDVLEEHGGTVLSIPSTSRSHQGETTKNYDDLLSRADFVIVRLASSYNLNAQSSPYYEKMRTDCWVELCIFHQQIVAPSEHTLCAPLTAPLPISALERCRIAVSGLSELEVNFLNRFSLATGLIVEKGFKRSTSTHLVCPSKQGQKYDFALKWGVPVVDFDWLYTMGYAIPADVAHDHTGGEDRAMSDVTNNSPSDLEAPPEPVAGKKRPIAAVMQPESATVVSSPRKRRERGSIIRVEKTPSLTTLPTAPPEPQAVVQSRRSSEARSTTVTPQKQQKFIPRDTPSRSRMGSTVPSSQSPSPLKSPAADRVRKELAAILEGEDAGADDDEVPLGELPPIRSAKSRLKSSTSGSSRSTSGGSLASKKKSRPKGLSRYQTVAGDAATANTRSSSLTSLSSVEGQGLKAYSSADNLGRASRPRAQRKTGEPSLSQDVTRDDSMRVTYDDPNQRAARRQLMDLVSSSADPDASPPVRISVPGSSPSDSAGELVSRREVPVRRSTRVAGF